jgi:hypothetical protein
VLLGVVTFGVVLVLRDDEVDIAVVEELFAFSDVVDSDFLVVVEAVGALVVVVLGLGALIVV